MRYISLFSGIEAASVAWEPLGWEPVAFSEIEPFPSAVLAERFPNVPNLGDICEIDWSTYRGAVDVVIGGSPCQSFSIAGGRASLDGESRLMFEYIRAIHDIRPRWLIWENVPGVFSVKDNAFGQLLDELEKLGYCLAWRTLDAQFFGVAQRRRRVFVIGHVGGMGGEPAAVLFERDSVRGNTQSSREKRESLTGAAAVGASIGFKFHQGSGAGGLGIEKEQSPMLTADWHNPAVISCIALQSDGSTSVNSHGDGYKTDGSVYALNLIDRQSVVCMTGDTSKAAVDSDLCGTLHVGGGCADGSVGALCARDWKGIGNQDAEQGKLIWQRTF